MHRVTSFLHSDGQTVPAINIYSPNGLLFWKTAQASDDEQLETKDITPSHDQPCKEIIKLICTKYRALLFSVSIMYQVNKWSRTHIVYLCVSYHSVFKRTWTPKIYMVTLIHLYQLGQCSFPSWQRTNTGLREGRNTVMVQYMGSPM